MVCGNSNPGQNMLVFSKTGFTQKVLQQFPSQQLSTEIASRKIKIKHILSLVYFKIFGSKIIIRLHLQQSEVYISPKINISARTLKMALHKNPVMHCDQVVIFLHGSQKRRFLCTIEAETHEICTVLSNTLFCLLFHYSKDHLGYFF